MSRNSRIFSIGAVVVAAASLGACVAPPPTYYNQPAYGAAPAMQPAPYPAYGAAPVHVEYGRVSNIEVMQAEQRRAPSGAGAIIGGVLGAVVGNQIGRGGGRALATGVGIVGGAVAGNQLEGNQRGPVVQSYRVSVQVDNGSARAYDVPSPGDLRVGDRVRIQDNQLQRI